MSGAYELQVGIYDALVADAALMALIVGVYDNPAQPTDAGDNTVFLYVTIGEDDITPWDTDTETGGEATANIHTWSRSHSRLQTKQIQQAIYDVLHRGTITMAGYTVVGIDLQNQGNVRDPDGITTHGVQTLKIIYEG